MKLGIFSTASTKGITKRMNEKSFYLRCNAIKPDKVSSDHRSVHKCVSGKLMSFHQEACRCNIASSPVGSFGGSILVLNSTIGIDRICSCLGNEMIGALLFISNVKIDSNSFRLYNKINRMANETH